MARGTGHDFQPKAPPNGKNSWSIVTPSKTVQNGNPIGGFFMGTTTNVIAMLVATLLLAIAIDRGVPNSIDGLAYVVERAARVLVACLRAASKRLRERHVAIERAEYERL